MKSEALRKEINKCAGECLQANMKSELFGTNLEQQQIYTFCRRKQKLNERAIVFAVYLPEIITMF